MAGLTLTALTPPAPIIAGLADLVLEVGFDCCVSRKELVIAAGHCLPHAVELLTPEASPRGGAVLSFGSEVLGDPLGGPAGPGLGGDPGHMRYADLPPVHIGDHVVGVPPFGCGLGILIRYPIPGNPVACGNLADRNLVFFGQYSRADHGGVGETLPWADGIRSYSR